MRNFKKFWVLPALIVGLLLGACLKHTQGAPSSPSTLASSVATSQLKGELGPGVPAFWVRPGYRVSLVAQGLENARFMEFDEKGVLYLSRPSKGDILSLRPKGERFEVVGSFVKGYPRAHGLCWEGGWLWFATSGRVYRARDTNGDGVADEVRTVVPEGVLPGGSGHWWSPLLVTGNVLYTGIGDRGNITDERNSDRQKIWQFNKDGSGKTRWSSGIRNTEKLRFRPGTNEMHGFDHGSDWFGEPLGDKQGRQPFTDYNPPEELNHYQQGKFYGHPFITGNMVPRYEYARQTDILDLAERTVPPAWTFPAHWAPNGFTFLDSKNGFGADHTGDIFAAFHGSWNRSRPGGYCVERVFFDKVTGRPFGNHTIVRCLNGNEVLARPVDCVQAPDGSVFFSCDHTQRIYRIAKSTGKS